LPIKTDPIPENGYGFWVIVKRPVTPAPEPKNFIQCYLKDFPFEIQDKLISPKKGNPSVTKDKRFVGYVTQGFRPEKAAPARPPAGPGHGRPINRAGRGRAELQVMVNLNKP
jgi:hypothetical protein